jgi:uncharacterized membrane protein YkvA (DUF1232 family)
MSQDLKDLDGIPDASKELWTKLVVEERRPLGFALADASMKLLTTLKDDTPEERRAAIQAAVRYFVIEDDADSDLDSILGLDDDAEVLNAVLKHLGHDDWLVEVL